MDAVRASRELETNPLSHNAVALEQELAWLAALLNARICLHFGQECTVRDVREIAPPELAKHPANSRATSTRSSRGGFSR